MTNDFLIKNFKHLTTTPKNVNQLKKRLLQMTVQANLTVSPRLNNPEQATLLKR